nr:VCOMET [synthetic construct]
MVSRRPWLLALALAVALAAGSAGASTGSDATVPVATQDGPDYVFHRAHERMLFQTSYTLENNGSVICIPNNGQCFCLAWLKSNGTNAEKLAANILQWVVFALSVACLGWYAYQAWRATCGWEEVYVALIEMMKSIIEAFHEFDSPATLWLSSGNGVVWMRYGEWLLTCPVLLIHLSNLTGLKDDYSKRTMGLLVSDVGCIVWGATSAMCTGWTKILFFLISLSYGMYTYFHAAKVYIEAFHTVPKGLCRQLVRAMAWLFFVSWGMFPVLFLLGPEGFGHISPYGSAIGHSILDLIAKNMWGVLGNYLRVKIHEHILLYGDIRKKQKITIAGQEMEVETLVAEEEDKYESS